jgi:hypothetical protein
MNSKFFSLPIQFTYIAISIFFIVGCETNPNLTVSYENDAIPYNLKHTGGSPKSGVQYEVVCEAKIKENRIVSEKVSMSARWKDMDYDAERIERASFQNKYEILAAEKLPSI